VIREEKPRLKIDPDHFFPVIEHAAAIGATISAQRRPVAFDTSKL
jgi:hypothetical protein